MKPKPPVPPACFAGRSFSTVVLDRLRTDTAPQATTSISAARQLMRLLNARNSIGAAMAPTENVQCSRFSAAALPSVTALTVALLKLVTPPRPMPVSMNARNSTPFAPHSAISAMPTNASADSATTVRLRPRYAPTAPDRKPAARLPMECADSSMPLNVSVRPFAAFRSGIIDPWVSASRPLTK